jgi:hypothetical protein
MARTHRDRGEIGMSILATVVAAVVGAGAAVVTTTYVVTSQREPVRAEAENVSQNLPEGPSQEILDYGQ